MKITIHSETKTGITDWELDRLVRARISQNRKDAISTLVSLSEQLTTLKTIVVQDHIRNLILKSLDNLDNTHQAILAQKYNEASQFSREAIVSAEKSFFDASMVPMLYFPGT